MLKINRIFDSIRNRFVISVLLLLMICFGLFLILFLSKSSNNIDRISRSFLSATAESFENNFSNFMLHTDDRDIEKMLWIIAQNDNIRHIQILDKNGFIRHTNIAEQIGQNVNDIYRESHKVDLSKISEMIITHHKESNTLNLFKPIFNNNECSRCHSEKVIAYLDIDTEIQGIEEQYFESFNSVVGVGLILIILFTFGLFFIFNRYFINPLNKISNAMNEVQRGNLDFQMRSQAGREFETIVSKFNEMTKELSAGRNKLNEMHIEELQQVNKLALLGELTAEVAHEVNNRCGIIQMRLDYMNWDFQHIEDLKSYISDFDTIENQINKISQTTKNILRHSKKSKVNFQKVDLIDVIDGAIEILRPLIKKNELEINFNKENDSFIVTGDPVQLEQVVLNLVYNSIDAINSNGIININLRKTNLRALLEISDNGSGMPEEEIKNCFMPFFSTKDSNRRSGLGLYIVKNICDRHEINLECSSKINSGTTFSLLFKI